MLLGRGQEDNVLQRTEQKPGVKDISDGSFYFSWSSGREKSYSSLQMNCANSWEGLSGQEQCMASPKLGTLLCLGLMEASGVD